MSKRTTTPAPGGRGRSAPVKISKPFPWGTVATSVVLGAALIGLLAYAFTNQGGGVRNVDEPFGPRLVKGEQDLGRGHVAGAVDYPEYPGRPPMGGDHNATPQQCAVYTEQIPAEHAVHSMEHGAVWITYQPELPEDQVDRLTELAEGDPYMLLSPLPGQESPIVLTSWARQLPVDTADDAMIDDFVDTYLNGTLTPERGAACIGNTGTGTLSGEAPTEDAMPSPAASPAATAPESPAAASASPAVTPAG
jgi:hypothetical protein